MGLLPVEKARQSFWFSPIWTGLGGDHFKGHSLHPEDGGNLALQFLFLLNFYKIEFCNDKINY
jgi:hypothetical protein